MSSNIVDVALDCLRFILVSLVCKKNIWLICSQGRTMRTNEKYLTFEQWFPSQNHVLDILEHIILMNLHVWKWFYDSISHQTVVGFTKLTKSVNKMTLLPFIWDHFRFSKSVKSSTAVKFNHLILKLSSRWPNELISLSYY